MIAPLLVMTLALPASGQDVHVELAGVTGFSSWTQSPANILAGAPINELHGGADLDVDWYPRRLRDDDAPPGLQPFLQRVTRLHLDVGLGGGVTSQAASPASPGGESNAATSRVINGGVTLGADGYARWLYWSVDVDIAAASWTMQPNGIGYTELRLPTGFSLGVRWRDVRVRAGWSVTPYRDADGLPWTVSFWGRAFAGVEAVVARRLEVEGDVYVLDGGAEVHGGASLYLGRRLALTASLGGGHGAWYDDTSDKLDAVIAGAGLDCWLGPRFAVAVGYAVTWLRSPGLVGNGTGGLQVETQSSSLLHLVTLTFHGRR